MTVKYPLCQLFTTEFLFACIEAAYLDVYGSNYDPDKALQNARELATVDGLVWG